MNEIKITTEYITLQQLMKFSGAVAIGSEAKILIQSGKVKVNGEICLMRGKKMRIGDNFEYNGESYTVV
ncbi:MAG: RNA-binding S4 domain-containing protein [Ruminococcus sp.]|jgi:ribosome-associated protein|nr:RNA-binding S4 domain-containing protein [Ruminococcus sp.]